MIIIITPLSFIPAMNIYETALLDGPNWKSISVAGAERTRERQRENELKGGKNCSALVPCFSSVFIVFHATIKRKRCKVKE